MAENTFGSNVQRGDITFTLCDPDKYYHTVQYKNELWYGMDSVASNIDNRDVKWYTIRKLRQLMLIEVEGKWAGFEWVPLD